MDTNKNIIKPSTVSVGMTHVCTRPVQTVLRQHVHQDTVLKQQVHNHDLYFFAFYKDVPKNKIANSEWIDPNITINRLNFITDSHLFKVDGSVLSCRAWSKYNHE